MRGRSAGFVVVLVLCFAVPAMSATISLPKTGQTKCYSGSSEVDCAGTGQDGEDQRGVAWPNPRYQATYCDSDGPCGDQTKDCDAIDGNNLITDYLTGLTWMGGPVFYPEWGTARKLTWEEALDLTKTWVVCGESNWRVPNIVELLSLSSYGTDARPPVGIWYYSWSGTTKQGDTGNAWVGYDSGRDIGMASDAKTNKNYATLVYGGTGGTVSLPRTGQTTSYWTGDDGNLKKGTEWPEERFTDNLDRTFTDGLTGIRWYKEVTSGWWGGVLDSAKSKNEQNYLCSNQWAVPNINELRSLFDYENYSPALPEGYLFNLPSEYGSHYFWSSTTHDDTPGSAFTVKRRDGYVTTAPKGYQDGYMSFLMVKGDSPLCVYTLTVSKTGSGQGTVTSSSGGINCGTACSATYGGGTAVTLTATATQGSVFTGWSGGGCSGTGQCVVTVNSTMTVTANFVPTYTVTVTRQGAGSGTVTSDPAGINCGTECSFGYASGVQVTLTAAAAAGSIFNGWTGCDEIAGGACKVLMVTDKFVYATFVPVRTLTVTSSGSGTGTVTSDPGGIDCGSACSAVYPQATVVTLTAAPATGCTFDGWSGGGCSGTGTCIVTLNSNTTVNAAFTLIPVCTYTLKPTSKAFTANGGAVTVNVTATGQAVCPAPAISAPGWATATAGTWKKNKETVKIVVPKNASSLPKDGIVYIGGTAFPVTQAAAVCAIKKFTPTSKSHSKGAQTGSFAVEVAPQDCAWTTTVNEAAASWLEVTSGAGTGNGTVNYSVDENPGKARSGTISVVLTQNAKKKGFTVKQSNK